MAKSQALKGETSNKLTPSKGKTGGPAAKKSGPTKQGVPAKNPKAPVKGKPRVAAPTKAEKEKAAAVAKAGKADRKSLKAAQKKNKSANTVSKK